MPQSDAVPQTINAINFLPMLTIMGVIFLVSHQPGDELHLPSIIGIDKLCHLLEYGLLAAACIYGFKPVRKENARKIGFIVVTICLLYAISDEIHQSFVPLRCASSADIVADVSGALLVVLFWLKAASSLKLLKV